MKKIKYTEDFPFKQDLLGKILPIATSIIIYIATITVIAVLIASETVHIWKFKFSGNVTIEIPHNMASQEGAIDDILHKINQKKLISSYKIIQSEEVISQALPTLDDGADIIKNTEISSFVHLKMLKDKNAITNLKLAINEISNDIIVHNHSDSYKPIINILKMAENLLILFVVLIIILAIITISFSTYATLMRHKKIVQILKLLGAPKKYISKQFSSYTMRVGVQSSLVSIVACVGTMLLMTYNLFGAFNNCFSSDPIIWCALITIPLLFTLLISRVSSLTVLLSLGSERFGSTQDD